MQTVTIATECSDLMQTIRSFAARVRDPANHPLPDRVSPQRMAVYEELVYNNIDELLKNAFPVLHAVSSSDSWQHRVRDFLAYHRARTPLFPEVPREFLSYLEQRRTTPKGEFPFLLELMHYEWLELALAISDAQWNESTIDPAGDLLEGKPVLSPLVHFHCYRYPVHRIGPDFTPKQPDASPTCLLVYRNREDQVGFMSINPITGLLLERLKSSTRQTGRALLEGIATETGHPNRTTLIEGGLQTLQMLRQADVILGTEKVSGFS
jgi:hypothetical protein